MVFHSKGERDGTVFSRVLLEFLVLLLVSCFVWSCLCVWFGLSLQRKIGELGTLTIDMTGKQWEPMALQWKLRFFFHLVKFNLFSMTIT